MAEYEMPRRTCVVCGKLVRHGEYLYTNREGSDVWLCGQHECDVTYNGSDENDEQYEHRSNHR